MNNYQYKAFISYRHTSYDQQIAKRLHSLLENYNIPSALKESYGQSKIGRVFRDQEELPLSSDLGADIHTALENSEWLICICSPRFIQSKWCAEEINYFISLGKKDHILAVLIEGEPQDSFPLSLRFETVEGKIIEKEPLAADVRAEDVYGSLKKLNNEKLRILAPILGVNYDELNQRAKKRRTKIIAGASAALIVLLSGFLTYVIIKNRQITQQKNSALIAESKWLSKSSYEALEKNNPTLAMQLAIEALPSEELDRPVVSEALSALYSSMFMKSHDSYETLYVISTEKLGGTKYKDVLFSCNESRLYLYREDYSDCVEYDNMNGEYLGKIDTSVSTSYKNYYNLREKLKESTIYNKDIFKGYQFNGYICDVRYCYNQSKYDNYDYSTDYLLLENYSAKNIEYLHEAYCDEIIHTYIPDSSYTDKYTGTAQYYRTDVCAFGSSYDGNFVYMINGYDLFVFEASSEMIVRNINYQDMGGYFYCDGDISNDKPLISFVTTGGNGFVYDYISDVIITLQNDNHSVDFVKFNCDGTRILTLSETTNTCDIYSASTGEMLGSYGADFTIERVDFGFKDSNMNATSDNYIIMGNNDYVQVIRSGSLDSNEAVTVIADAYSTSWQKERYPQLSEDGTLLWTVRAASAAVAFKDRDYRLSGYSVETGEIVYDYPSDIFMNYLKKDDEYILNFGEVYYPQNDTDRYACIRIYNGNTGKMIADIRPSFDYEGETISLFSVDNAVLNDAKTLLYAYADVGSGVKTIHVIMVFDVNSGEMLWYKVDKDQTDKHFNYRVFVEGNFNIFVRNDVLRINYGYGNKVEDSRFVYYNGYSGEEVDYQEDVEQAYNQAKKKKNYKFNGHTVMIDGTTLVDAETKEQLIDFRKTVEIIDDSGDGKKLLITYYAIDPDDNNAKGQLYLLNQLSVEQLIKEAERILDGRQLNQQQRQQYFLDD